MKGGSNKPLLNSERFELLEEERINFLKKLTIKRCKKIMNEFFSKDIYQELKGIITEDNPLSLRRSLKRIKRR